MVNYIPSVPNIPLFCKGLCLEDRINSYVYSELFLWISEQYIVNIYGVG